MAYEISKQPTSEQTVLVQRKKASQGPEISKAIGDALGAVFAYAHQNGLAIAGRPFARYLDVNPGSMTFEPGVAIAPPSGSSAAGGPSDPDAVRIDTLPGGFAAATLHRGPYDRLGEAYAALEKWIEAEGLTANGPPWEVYITDPTEVENPEDWETQVYWPVA